MLVIGATNRPHDIDAAFLRRMPRQILFDLPGPSERADILKVLLESVILDRRSLPLLLPFVLPRTEGFSGSDLKELCKYAAMQPVREYVRAHKQHLLANRTGRRQASDGMAVAGFGAPARGSGAASSSSSSSSAGARGGRLVPGLAAVVALPSSSGEGEGGAASGAGAEPKRPRPVTVRDFAEALQHVRPTGAAAMTRLLSFYHEQRKLGRGPGLGGFGGVGGAGAGAGARVEGRAGRYGAEAHGLGLGGYDEGNGYDEAGVKGLGRKRASQGGADVGVDVDVDLDIDGDDGDVADAVTRLRGRLSPAPDGLASAAAAPAAPAPASASAAAAASEPVAPAPAPAPASAPAQVPVAAPPVAAADAASAAQMMIALLAGAAAGMRSPLPAAAVTPGDVATPGDAHAPHAHAPPAAAASGTAPAPAGAAVSSAPAAAGAASPASLEDLMRALAELQSRQG